MRAVFLIADPDDGTRREVIDLFTSLDTEYEAQAVSTAEEALHALKKNRVGIFLCSMRLPDLDGLTLLKYFKQASPKTKLILLTEENEFIGELDDYGCQVSLNKPIRKQAFLQAVDSALGTDTFSSAVHSAFCLTELLEFYASRSESRILRVISPKEIGLLVIRNGVVVHAKFGSYTGSDALGVLAERDDISLHPLDGTIPTIEQVAETKTAIKLFEDQAISEKDCRTTSKLSAEKELATPVPPLSPGEVIGGRFEIVKTIGKGGMGMVYLAEDKALGREEVAVKVLGHRYSADTEVTKRFVREVQLMRRVNHTNVVRTYDFGQDGDRIFYTMEYLNGMSVAEVIEQKQSDINAAIAITLQLCDGLEAIHQLDIVHRDFKPDNVVLTNDGSAQIIDFGIARPGVSNLTTSRDIVGSLSYISPEVWLGQEVSNAVDLYGLGLIFYELLCGKAAFRGRTAAELMRKHLEWPVRPPSHYNSDIPLWLDELVNWLLEKDPRKRPDSARLFANELLSKLGQSEPIRLQA